MIQMFLLRDYFPLKLGGKRNKSIAGEAHCKFLFPRTKCNQLPDVVGKEM